MDTNFKRDIICISSLDWFPLPTRKQNVMLNMPKDCKILYIDFPITLLSPFKDPTRWEKWKIWWNGVRKLEGRDNIFLYCPPPLLPFGNKFRIINKFNQWWQSVFIKKEAKKLGIKNPIIWNYMHVSADIVDYFKDRSLTLYDCFDDVGEYEYVAPINKELIYKMETDLVKKCDVVFTTTPGLKEGKEEHNSNIHIIPNAANIELFMKATYDDTIIADDIKDIKGPVIGFIGVIEQWVDLDIMYDIASKHPEWSLVLIGPIGIGAYKDKVEKLQTLKNVHFLGRKNQEELPSYMKAFDVCINPFRGTKLTKNVSPLKFYEYMATGKPIVSVDMPAVREFGDIIYIAKDNEEFVKLVEKSLLEDSASLIPQRIEKAKQNSWEARVKYMIEKIQETYNNKK